MLDGYERERRERAKVLKSFLRLWDRDHADANPAARDVAEYAFLMGHMSAHQDISNRAMR